MKHWIVLAQLALVAPSFAAVPVQGKVTGFSRPNQADHVYGAIVIPSVRPEKLLALQFDDFVAPNEDLPAGPITIRVPGNLYVPRQTQNYGMFPIQFAKERYSYYPAPGIMNEIAAIAFSAPFGPVVDAFQGGGPITDVLPLLKLRETGFVGDRDWSAAPNPVDIALSMTTQKTLPFTWIHPGAPSGTQDVVIAFQKTPAGRWLLSDLAAGSATKSSQLATFANFQPEMKTLYARIYNSSNSPIPARISAFVRTGAPSEAQTLNGVPADITGAQVSASGKVQWSPIPLQGWVAILRDNAKKIVRNAPFGAALLNFALPMEQTLPKTTLEGWVAPSAGQFQLPSALGTDHISLVFVGTDRAVPMPTTDSGAEPQIFTYANEIRFVRIP